MNSLKSLYKAPYNQKRQLFALVRFFYWKIIRLFKLKNVSYRIWGDKIILLHYNSFQSMWLMYNYYVDWEEFNLISKFIRPDDEVFDIGANMGLYTVWMSKFISNGRIHSFEPDTINFKRLQKCIVLNNLQHVVIANNIALSDVDGQLGFTTGLDIENHIIDHPDSNTEMVESQRTSSYMTFKNIHKIAYLKIDVEGFECSVLKGAETNLLNKNIDIIQLEINSSIRNSGKTIQDLLELLDNYHYTLCRYDVDANELLKTVFSAERENYFAVNNMELINIKLKNNFETGFYKLMPGQK